MAAPTQTLAPFNIGALLQPDLSVQQAQIDRQRAIAQALSQQAMEPIDAGRGAVSWSQGVAKMVQALAGGLSQRAADTRQQAWNHSYRQSMGMEAPPFPTAMPSGDALMSGAQAPYANTPPAPMPSGAALMNGAQAPQTPDMGAITAPAPQPQQGPAQVPQVSPAAARMASALSAQQGPQQAPQGPQGMQGLGGLSMPGGNPIADMVGMNADMPGYLKDLRAANAPTDPVKLVTQAQALYQAGNNQAGDLLMAEARKAGYIEPLQVRQGSTVLAPGTNQPMFYNPSLDKGFLPSWNANGAVTGATVAPGVLPGTAQLAQAEASGKTIGTNAYEPQAGFDAQGNPVFGSKLDAARGGGPNFLPGPKLGASAAADVIGTKSAQTFQNISEAAADVPNRINALNEMQRIAADPKTVLGPGSASMARFNGLMGTFAQSAGIPFSPNIANNSAEFNKWAAQYAARSAAELGLSGSDKRIDLAIHASPNGEMPRGALAQVIPSFIGIENAKAGRAAAAAQWQQNNGPMDAQNFTLAWNHNFDPRIYTWLAEGPQAFQQHVQGLKAPEAAAMANKYRVLKQIGALP